MIVSVRQSDSRTDNLKRQGCTVNTNAGPNADHEVDVNC